MKSECCADGACAVDGRVPRGVVARALEVGLAWAGADPDHRELEGRFMGVTPAFFARACAAVARCEDIEATHEDVITDMFHSGGVRTRRSHRSGDVVHVKKSRRVFVDVEVRPGSREVPDFPGRVRVSSVVETPVVVPSKAVEMRYVRRQNRQSHVFGRGFCLDFSTVRSGKTMRDMEGAAPTHEIEFELKEPLHRACVGHVVESLLLKMLGFCHDAATTYV